MEARWWWWWWWAGMVRQLQSRWGKWEQVCKRVGQSGEVERRGASDGRVENLWKTKEPEEAGKRLKRRDRVFFHRISSGSWHRSCNSSEPAPIFEGTLALQSRISHATEGVCTLAERPVEYQSLEFSSHSITQVQSHLSWHSRKTCFYLFFCCFRLWIICFRFKTSLFLVADGLKLALGVWTGIGLIPFWCKKRPETRQTGTV